MQKYEEIETHTRPPPAICMLWKTKSPSSDSALMGNSCSRSGSTDTPPAEQTKRRHRRTIGVAIADAPNSGQPHHSPHMLLLLVLLVFVAPSEDHPSHSLHMLMVGLWLYRRPPAHCRNDHMAALLTGPGAPNAPATFSDPLRITFPLLLRP